jgi:hypothetical protein
MPWSVPRLRGRGEQGEIVRPAHLLSALYAVTCTRVFAPAGPWYVLLSHHRAHTDNRAASRSSLLTTASQARRAPRRQPP